MMSGNIRSGKEEIVSKLQLFLLNGGNNELFTNTPKRVSYIKSDDPKHVNIRKQSHQLKSIKVDGIWEGPMTNSKGSKASKSVLKLHTSPDGRVLGSWHAGWRVKNVHQEGNVLTWQHKKLNNGCKDYQNKLEISSINKATLLYQVHDRCNKPHNYTGRAELTRTANSSK